MKLMIVDDHQVVRQGIANLLRSMLPAVAITEVDNGQDAVAFGASASATATDSVAIGRQASATHFRTWIPRP